MTITAVFAACGGPPHQTRISISRSEANATGKVVHFANIPLAATGEARIEGIRTTCGCLQVEQGEISLVNGQAVAHIQLCFHGLLPQGDRQAAYLEVCGSSGSYVHTVDVDYPPREGARQLTPPASYIPNGKWSSLSFSDRDLVSLEAKRPQLISLPDDIAAQGCQLEITDDQCPTALSLRIKPGPSPCAISLNFRLANQDVVSASVYAEGDSRDVVPDCFVTTAGEAVQIKATRTITAASCAHESVAVSHTAAAVEAVFMPGCATGKGELVVVMEGPHAEVAVPFYVVDDPSRRKAGDSAAIVPSETLFDVLSVLRIEAATYRLRRRTLDGSGVSQADLGRLVESALAAPGSRCAGWWAEWERMSRESHATFVTTDETYDISSWPGMFMQRYVEFMKDVPLTERPTVDLYSSQHLLRLMSDERFAGGVAHLKPRLPYLLQDTYSILAPLPCAEQQLATMLSWDIDSTDRQDYCVISCVNPGGATAKYEFWMPRGGQIPYAVTLMSGNADLAAVFDWTVFNGVLFASRVGKVRRQAGRCLVEYLEVSDFCASSSRDGVVLRAPKPAKLLDLRGGPARYVDFDVDKLPRDVRDIFRVE